MLIQITAIILLSVFYLSYLLKMLLLRKQGIKGDLLGKGKKSKRATGIERVLKLITWLGAAVQFVSVILLELIPGFVSAEWVRIFGAGIGFAAVLFFVASITVMRNNWRAGFDENQDTRLVTAGVYRFSRNPAFVGFDLLYIGCAMMFPNVVNIAFAVIAVVSFHIQILGEENFLSRQFGKEYEDYRSGVRRYL